MSIKNRLLAGFLGALMLLNIAACEEEIGDGDGKSTLPTVATTEDEEDQEIDIGDVGIDFENVELENKVVNYMGGYDLTKAGDIRPFYKVFRERYDASIEVELISTDPEVFKTALQSKIVSDQSPDLVDRQDNTYPANVFNNMYESLDDYIDLNLPQWQPMKEYVEQFSWNDKNYYYPWIISGSPDMLIYDRGLFNSEGLDDPKALYDAGEWTWDSFKKIAEAFVAKDPANRIGMYGREAAGLMFLNSTGESILAKDENGKLVNNLKSQNFQRAAEFLQDLRDRGISKLPDLVPATVATAPIYENTAAFQLMGGWIISGYAEFNAKNDRDIFFVPVPRDPQADKYYMRATSFGYLVPSGAKNIEGAATFINCARLSQTDPELKQITYEATQKGKKYSDEMMEFFETFKETENFNYITDEPFGFSIEVNDMLNGVLTDLAFEPEEPQTWAQMRDGIFDVFNAEVEKYNQLIN